MSKYAVINPATGETLRSAKRAASSSALSSCKAAMAGRNA